MDCAGKFERELADLPGVSRVQLNFGASKLLVEGDFAHAAIAAVGQRHNVGVREESAPEAAQPFWAANPQVAPAAAAGVLIAAGWLAQWVGVSPVPFCLGAILIGGWQVGQRGLRSIARLDFNMDALMTIAVIGAGMIGQWSEGAMVAFLFGVSATLESYTMDRARRSLRALLDVAPKVARIRRQGSEMELPVTAVQVTDLLIVRPGEKIAMDGRITAGSSTINQAAITGESMPMEKGVGDDVFAGTLNGHGGLEVEVTKFVADSTFAKIVHLVEEAQAQRAPSQTFVERFAKVYTPAVIVLSALVVLIPPLLFAEAWAPWIYRGLTLLVVSCPCALVVSTPVSIVSAISNAARNGVLIKGGAHLELAAAIETVAFDKTGTLTKGEPEVTDMLSFSPDHSDAAVLSLAAAVESRSEHPLARAILRRANGQHVAHTVADFAAIAGRGAKALVDGRTVYVGNGRFFADDLKLELGEAAPHLAAWQGQGKTVMLVGDQSRVVGGIAVADTLRETSADVIQHLKVAGITRTIMLTGDNAVTAQAVADAVRVDQVRAELLPHEKLAVITELAAQGPVAMVGDGINDAPALAAATLGIAMGGAGTDVALETADIVLMSDDLSKLPFTIRLSKRTLRIIKQNIGLALVLKLLAVVAVFPGWLTLWLAVLADTGATVLVTLNGMRLLRTRP